MSFLTEVFSLFIENIKADLNITVYALTDADR